MRRVDKERGNIRRVHTRRGNMKRVSIWRKTNEKLMKKNEEDQNGNSNREIFFVDKEYQN